MSSSISSHPHPLCIACALVQVGACHDCRRVCPQDGVAYRVENLDLTGIRIAKEDIHVRIGNITVSGKNEPSAPASASDASAADTQPAMPSPMPSSTPQHMDQAAGASESASPAPATGASTTTDLPDLPDRPDGNLDHLDPADHLDPPGPAPSSPDEVLSITASKITAEFKNVKWSYEQTYFPYLRGEGKGLAKARASTGLYV
ncbi:hypothetical protein CYMTET_35230 [Cymbomonas tetramitiformis]|uniref:Uncharacterized protein n=1 Tax=Cymbomonas tetramitiformis TaxID=36881 RepID=A0AAE0F9L3_9CHLO|nr:hypothetical protein CYMTET_35230 [Cymbomonas tetramitiformis]